MAIFVTRGSSQYMARTTTLSVATADRSFSGWIRYNSATNYPALLIHGTDTAGNNTANGIYIFPDRTLNLNLGTGGAYNLLTSTTLLTVDAWTFVVGVIKGGASGYLKIYQNGAETDTVGTVLSPETTARGLVTGRWSAAAYVTSRLFDLRYYSKILSPDEIKTMYYAQGDDAIVDSLVGRWIMNDKANGTNSANAANEVVDAGPNGYHLTPYNTPVYYSSPGRAK